MKISDAWLREYIPMDIPPLELSNILTGIGLEVEGMEHFEAVRGGLEGVIVGEVKSCRRHPNADKLMLTTVDVGGGRLLSVVCGAPNVAVGQKVPVALVGTKLYKGDEVVEVKKARLRGELSEGMICAEDELGLGTDHSGIMVLDPAARTGMTAREYFRIESDTIYEIGLTPNRIESGSHYGVARDLFAYFSIRQSKELVLPDVSRFSIDNRTLHIPVEILVPEACFRYTGITLSDVTVAESPAWLKNRLLSIGQNPINNVVDITNYVLHETGQPLHAFDADMIHGNKVVVRTMPEGTSFITLDGVERALSAEDLMICNTQSPMCIGGVFGGAESGVTGRTTRVFLESAYFNPVSIRRTSKRHGLNTDASFRFERGADPTMTIYALKRAALLIREIAGGTISSDIVDVVTRQPEAHQVNLSFSQISRLTGVKMEPAEVKKILIAMDMEIIGRHSDGISVRVPSYKVDVTREADLIEELLRMYGYDHIVITGNMNSSMSFTTKPDKEKILNTISDLLVSHGFYEIMTNSLTTLSYYEPSTLYPASHAVRLQNPLSSDLGVMRQTLLFGGLETIVHNTNRQRPDNRFFEYGNVYRFKNPGSDAGDLQNYQEESRLALWIIGNTHPQHWMIKAEPTNFYHLKTYTEMVLDRLGIQPDSLEMEDHSTEYISEGLRYSADGQMVLEMGELHPRLLKHFDIREKVYYSEFRWFRVLDLLENESIRYHELPRFPEVRRDLALLLDKDIPFRRVKELAWQTENILLKNISLFDVYEGEQVGKNKKSYAISFVLQDMDKTLTDKEIDEVMKRFIACFEKELGAKIR